MTTTEALDTVEQELETAIEGGISWLKNPKTTVILAGTIGVLSGALVSYLVANSRLKAKYQKQADEEIASVKEHYSILRKEGVSLEELAAQYPDEEKKQHKNIVSDILDKEGYVQYNKVEPTVSEEPEEDDEEQITITQAIIEATSIQHRNVFESDNPDTYFDFREEEERRNKFPNKPHVITKDEFDQNETDYDQARLTYYDGDDVLTDDKDAPADVEKLMGYENLLRFGHGSGDPRIVYIRNPELQLDFEVVQSDGKFAKEVLGFDDELRHSHRRPQRKFRDRDE